MYIREESLLESITNSACAKCKSATEFSEQWHGAFLYKEGTCNSCGEEHHIFLKKI